MDQEIHDRLLNEVKILRDFLSKFSAHQIGSAMAVYLRKWHQPNQSEVRLTSPGKQSSYLLGLLLSTPEPENSEPLNKENIDYILEQLNKIFNCYPAMYWPRKEEIESQNEKWYHHREVAMPAFLHYFFNPLLASVEQVRDRITVEVKPYNNVIENETGLSIDALLETADKIAQYQQDKLAALGLKFKSLKEKQKEVFENIPQSEFSEDQFVDAVRKTGADQILEELHLVMDQQFIFNSDEIDCTFKELFFDQFSIERGSDLLNAKEREFTYPTERNLFEDRPLIKISSNTYLCYSTNALYIAILTVATEIILNSVEKDRFLKRRDKSLENLSEKYLLPILSESARSERALFETASLQNEHDLIVVSERNLFLVEAKASPPKEPARNPDSAFEKIHNHFHSKKGIQKGFDQANSLRDKILSEGSVVLYDDKRKIVLALNKDDFDNIFCIVVTRDDFGPLATNLNLLLQKNDQTQYPWVVSILELETISTAFRHLGKDEKYFADFLTQRLKLHGKVQGSDELEFVGYFLRHGGFKDIQSTGADKMFLDASYSDVFDEIYVAELTGEKIKIEPKPPFMSNLKTGEIKQFSKSKAATTSNSREKSRKAKRKQQKNARKRNRTKKK